MGYKPVQVPNQLANYAQMQQIMGGQQEQQLNALKMQEYERARTEQEGWSNYLAQADLTNPQTRIGALKYGKRGAEFGKALSEQEKDVAAATSSAATAQKTNIDNSRSLLVGVNDQPAYDAWRAYSIKNIPELANILPAQFTPEGKDSLLRTAEDLSKRLTAAPTTVAAGGSVYDPATKTFTQAPEKTPAPPAPPSMVAEYTFAKTPDGGNFKGSYQDFVTARAAAGRAPAQPRAEPAPRTQQLTLSDGSVVLVNMDTGVTTPITAGGAGVKGKPSATAEKTAIQRKQLGLDLDNAITELTDVIKEGGLIDQSTGSGAGRLIDLAAGFGGTATSGAIAIGKLQPIADLALKMVPRFEGPQSNADATSYKQAAGQLADATLPREIRKEAAKTVLRLMKSRKNQFASPEMAAEGVAPAPVSVGSIRDQADAILRGSK